MSYRYSCPSAHSTTTRTIEQPYAYDHPHRYRKNPTYRYTTSLCPPNHEIFARDPYADMESFIPTISAESLPWLQLGEEKLAQIVRLPRGRRVAKHFRRAARAVRDCLIYVRPPSQVQAPFPRRWSAL